MRFTCCTKAAESRGNSGGRNKKKAETSGLRLLCVSESICAFCGVVDCAIYGALQRIGVAGFGNREADRRRLDLFRCEELDGQRTVRNPRFDLDVIVRVVLEPEVLRAVINTCIASDRAIGNLLRVLLALHNGVVSQQCGVEHRGCNLADAAADLLCGAGAAGKDGSRCR